MGSTPGDSEGEAWRHTLTDGPEDGSARRLLDIMRVILRAYSVDRIERGSFVAEMKSARGASVCFVILNIDSLPCATIHLATILSSQKISGLSPLTLRLHSNIDKLSTVSRGQDMNAF